MKAQPFAPVPNLPADLRIAAALEYATYYLSEIEVHLSKIAAHAEPNSSAIGRLASALTGIGNILPHLLNKKQG